MVHTGIAVLITALLAAQAAPERDIIASRVGLQGGGCSDDFVYHGTADGIRAFSIASTMCNLGTEPLEVSAITTDHPVIGQNLFRLQDGRFEQVGQSWVVHTFCAINEPSCGDCQPTSCSTLGARCASTQYGTISDGALGGPKVWIDPQGVGPGGTHMDHDWPPPAGPFPIAGRLQVHDADIVVGPPPENGGVHYVAEIQHVTHDENPADRNNNASWRPVYFEDPTTLLPGEPCEGSVRTATAAIEAWSELDSEVELIHVYEDPDAARGRITVGYRVQDNGDGTWDYEYAVYNMNAARGMGRFAVPIPAGVGLTGIGFHDVDYHSGDGIDGLDRDGTDWSASLQGGFLTWSTVAYADDPNANALLWGTLYNFRFTADTGPGPAELTLTLFAPGTPDDIPAPALAPVSLCDAGGAGAAQCADADADGIRDDSCVWSACEDGTCAGTYTVFADMGGPNGSCPADGTADANDRFHALNCFANTSTFGTPGYPCEDQPPNATNVDAGGPFGQCCPDGVCDGNDAFHALNAFAGDNPCQCPANFTCPCPSPTDPPGDAVLCPPTSPRP